MKIDAEKKEALDPTTSPDKLLALIFYYPSDVLSNLVFPLIFLERPNFLHEIGERRIVILLSQSNCPDWFKDMVASSIYAKENPIIRLLSGRWNIKSINF